MISYSNKRSASGGYFCLRVAVETIKQFFSKNSNLRMVKMKTILVVLHFFFAAAFAPAQVVPWSYTNTGIVHTIHISSATIFTDSIANTPIQPGDAVGVFYDSLGYLACGGYSIWPATEIKAYGDNSGEPNGFLFNQQFMFKIWSKQRNCIIDSGSTVKYQYMPPTYNDSAYFKGAGGSSKLILLMGAQRHVYYAKSNFCAGDPNPSPLGSTIPGLTYSSQAGLVINSTTGQINVAASTPGSYTVYFNTPLCMRSYSFPITIKLNLDKLSVNVTKSTCTEGGEVQIDPNTILCGTAPYLYKLRNVITGAELKQTNIPVFTNVEDATYELLIRDANAEEVKWFKTIVISKNCKDLLISPNSPNGQFATYYIPYQGNAKIYDRFGLLKKEMSIPADWDATDNSGNQVAMGQYVIICNEEKQIVVTVIK